MEEDACSLEDGALEQRWRKMIAAVSNRAFAKVWYQFKHGVHAEAAARDDLWPTKNTPNGPQYVNKSRNA